MAWWERVRERREQLGISGVELAEQVGVTNQRISDFEAGRYKNPRLETLLKVATALKLSMDDLVGSQYVRVTPPVRPGTENVSSEHDTKTVTRGADDNAAAGSLKRRDTPDTNSPLSAVDAAHDLLEIGERLTRLAEKFLSGAVTTVVGDSARRRTARMPPAKTHGRKRQGR